MAGRALAAAAIAVVLLSGAACGRALPDEAQTPTGPVETGAFEEPATGEGETEGAIRAAGGGAARDYLAAVGEGLQAEDPTVTLRVAEAEPDYGPLCAGRLDVVAATGDADEDVCGGNDAVAGFRVAEAAGEPVVFFVNREALLQRFEIEALIQYAVDNGETLPRSVGLQPLPIEQLQETQTKLEQVVAGVA